MRGIKRFSIAGVLAAVSACSTPGGDVGSGSGGESATGSAGSAAHAGGASSVGPAGAAGALASAATAGSEPSGGASAGSAGGSAGGAAPVTLPTLVTSGPNAYWQTDGQLVEVDTDAADVTVDASAVAQIWQGFGGTFSERAGSYLSLLSASDRARALNLLFGQDGLRFSYGRIPIGASDYSFERHSLDETADDLAMSQFSIEPDKQQLIPFILAARAIAPQLHLSAIPWSPPTWMKNNRAFDGGNMNEDDATLHAYALYLTKFVQEYDKLGIPIEVLQPQKEPNLELDFPSCIWSAAGMSKFIGAHLGPMFAEQKISTQIFLGSLSEDGGNGKGREIVAAVTADAAAMSYVHGFGFEWEASGLLASVRSKNLPIWQGNHNVGNLPWQSTGFEPNAAPNDHAYAESSWVFIRDWIHGGVGAYFTSNMVLDSVGQGNGRLWPQNALLVVDASTKKLILTPAFYLFRHLSPFVDPGAQVIQTSGGDALAFKNPDGTLVAVLYNSGDAARTTVAIAGKKLQFDMPAHGWATLRVN